MAFDGKKYELDENDFIFIKRNKVLCPGEVVKLIQNGGAKVIDQ